MSTSKHMIRKTIEVVLITAISMTLVFTFLSKVEQSLKVKLDKIEKGKVRIELIEEDEIIDNKITERFKEETEKLEKEIKDKEREESIKAMEMRSEENKN